MIRKQDLAAEEVRLKAWLKTKMPRAEGLSITPLTEDNFRLSKKRNLFL